MNAGVSHEVKRFAHTDHRTSPPLAAMLRIAYTRREQATCRTAGKTARLGRLAFCSSGNQYLRSHQMAVRRCRTRHRRGGRHRDGLRGVRHDVHQTAYQRYSSVFPYQC